MRRPLALLTALLLPAASLAQTPTETYDVLGQWFSGETAALGGGGTFLPSTEPFAALRSPARYAQAGRTPGLYVNVNGGLPFWGDWDDDYDVDVNAHTNGVAATAGHRVALPIGRVALGAGAGYTREVFADQERVDEQGNPLGTFDAVEGVFMAGVGAGFSGPVLIDAGLAFRYARRGYSPDTSPVSSPSFDLGVTATLPLRAPLAAGDRALLFDLSVGYAQRHIGPDATWENGGVALVSPRTATLGYAVRAGYEARRPLGTLRLVGLDLTAEADGTLNLIGFDEDGNGGPVPGIPDHRDALIGDLGVGSVLLGDAGDDYLTVTGRRGIRFTALDAVWIAAGQFHGGGVDRTQTTAGIGVSTGGILYAAGVLRDDAHLAALGRRYDVRYTLATAFATRPYETTFTHTLTLAWRGW